MHAERAKDERVGDAEYRRVRADADSDRQHRDRRKPRAGGEHPQRMTDVLPQLAGKPEAPGLTRMFGASTPCAELGACEASGLRARQSARRQIVGALLEMEGDLV